MYIAIRKDSDGKIYIDKFFFKHRNIKDLKGSLYSQVEIPDEIFTTVKACDFNVDLSFDMGVYRARLKKESIEKRIEELKSLLASQDYKTIKYVHGELSEDEFAEVKKQCKIWRDEINSLEQQ